MAGKSDASDFKMVEPEDIRAEKMTVNYLILKQLDRINFLLTVGMTGVGERKLLDNVTLAIKVGLRSIESMMKNDLPKGYHAKAEKLKRTMPAQLGTGVNMDNNLFKWYDLLVEQFPAIYLVPDRKLIYDFED